MGYVGCGEVGGFLIGIRFHWLLCRGGGRRGVLKWYRGELRVRCWVEVCEAENFPERFDFRNLQKSRCRGWRR